jgi:hypothetical protein
MVAHISALSLPNASTGAAPDRAAATLASWLRHGDVGIAFRLRRLFGAESRAADEEAGGEALLRRLASGERIVDLD